MDCTADLEVRDGVTAAETAGMTELGSAIFADGWRERLGVDYGDLQWVETGDA